MNFHDKEPQLIEREPSKLKEHFQRGMTAFLVIVAGVLFFFAMYRMRDIVNALERVIEILSPIIMGFVFAFLLNPIVKRTEKIIRPLVNKLFKKEKHAHNVSRIFGIMIAFVVAFAFIVALFNMIIPELYSSVKDLVVTMPEKIHSWSDKLDVILKENSTLDRILKSAIIKSNDSLEEWISNDLLKMIQVDNLTQSGSLVSSLTAGVISVVQGVTNLLIGIIVSVYLLFSKEKFMRQSKKVTYALCKPKRANFILHIGRKANDIFGGFIIGKIIDSAIVGVLCFAGVSIFKMPYPLLISMIVGVTNVIPVFGPYIGAIPCALLIFLVDPMKGIGFVVFIILLQQLDGNVIGPKILGESTGLSSFWVIFAILIAGKMFGVGGMIIGVPVFALIYYVIKLFIQQKLEAKNLPTDTELYTDKCHVNDEGEFVVQVESDLEEKEHADSSTE